MKRIRTLSLVLVVVGLLGTGCNNSSSVASGGSSTTDASPTDTNTSPSPDDTDSSSPEPDASLEDGRHFVLAVEVAEKGGGPQLRFDLAYFLTGDEATQAAKDHGDEYPPPNDYYIVNDNPKLRWLPVSASVKVKYIPNELCCDLVSGNFDAWTEAVNETNQTDYAGKNVPWWITVSGGQVVKIEQQYLP
ncbi:MAG TPA: hypothetical protein VGR41_07820 [Actinomycetota bacterium]|nr:hypothetical protein [Actinomycetota bacterium]